MIRRLAVAALAAAAVVGAAGSAFLAFILWSDAREEVARIEQHRGLM